jgi:hypothetical protein
MTAAAWITLAIGLLSILGSWLGAWMAVRIAQARDAQRIATLELEVNRLRNFVHDFKDHVGPMLVYAQMFKEHIDRERAKH